MAPASGAQKIVSVTLKNTGIRTLHILVDIHQKYQLEAGEEKTIVPESQGYTVKADKTHVAEIQYPSSDSFEVTKDDSITGGKFRTTVEYAA